jgi:excinuclease ABC subunit C
VASFLPQFYSAAKAIPPLIVVPYPPEDSTVAQVLIERRGGQVRIRTPRGAAEKRLAALARTNGIEAALAKQRQPLGEQLQKALRLNREPQRIECVDASHLAGEGMRVGMVVYEDGEPLKDAYRAYAFPELEGTADDYLALASWTKRRVESGEPWPDLILVDGGRGQLGAVGRALGEALESLGDTAPDIELASIAKAGRAAGELGDEVYRPNRKNPLPLKAGSTELLFLQRMRDAAHRFIIGRQRKGRSKKALASELTNLPGVGPKTAKLLWQHFDSLDAMRQASLEELAALPGLGAKRAVKLHQALAGSGQASNGS